MTHDESLPERFPDLLGPQPLTDPALVRLVADLDTLHAAHEPPATLAAALDRALGERAARANIAADQTSDHLAARQYRPTYRPPSEGRTPVTPRRLTALLGSLAAVLVVGLMAALLLGGRGTLGLGGPKGHETPEQAFARLGGARLVLQVACPTREPKCDYRSRLPLLVDTLQRRLATGLGVRDAAVTVLLEKDGYADVQIEIPSKTDLEMIAENVAVRGELDTIDTHGVQLPVGELLADWMCLPQATTCWPDKYEVIFDGSQIDTSTLLSATDANSGKPVVTFALKQDSRQRFAEYTHTHIGMYLTVVLDGKVIESAIIQSEIDGSVQITGFGSTREGHDLMTYLKAGALPLSASVLSSEVVPGGTTSNPHPCATSTSTPTPTPGAGSSSGQSGLIQNVVTATGVDAQFNPTGVTSHFTVNSMVYVAMAVRDVHPGETHTISIRWFLNGQDLQLPPAAGTSTTISGDRQIFFSLTYPQPGAGMAKIYVDRPANATGDDPHDPALAATIFFDVELQGAAPAPTVTPIVGGVTTTSAASAGCATPTATSGSTGTATPPATPTPTATPA